MTDIFREVPDHVVAAIELKALRVALSRTEYLRRTLLRESNADTQPVTLASTIVGRQAMPPSHHWPRMTESASNASAMARKRTVNSTRMGAGCLRAGSS